MADNEAVARIQDIKLLKGVHVPQHYAAGKFMPVSLNKNMVGPVQDVPAVVVRRGLGAQAAVAHIGQLLNVGDVVRTGPDTVMTIEFLIGGRVGVNKSTCTEIASERTVADREVGFWQKVCWGVPLLLKADAHTLRRPIEIQTNGGTMGIKG